MATASFCCRFAVFCLLVTVGAALPSASTVDAQMIRNSLFLTQPLRTPPTATVNVIMAEGGLQKRQQATSFLAAAAAEPFFPAGSDALLPAVAAKIKKLDFPSEAASVDAMVTAARKELAASLEKEGLREELDEAVAKAATLAVKRYVYLGGCPRDFSATCPLGWTAGSGDTCAPPASYGGACGSMSFKGLGQSELEAAVLKCSVNFPCASPSTSVSLSTHAAPCDRGFAACPEGWEVQNGLCVAAGSYDGLCSPVADLRDVGDEGKASWAARCNVRFSCTGA